MKINLVIFILFLFNICFAHTQMIHSHCHQATLAAEQNHEKHDCENHQSSPKTENENPNENDQCQNCSQCIAHCHHGQSMMCANFDFVSEDFSEQIEFQFQFHYSFTFMQMLFRPPLNQLS